MSKRHTPGFQLPPTVKDAAILFDKILPEWFKKIDLAYLDMDDDAACVLGQLSLALLSKLTFLTVVSEEPDFDKAFAALFPKDSSKGSVFWDSRRINLLDTEWRLEIHKRLHPRKAKTGVPQTAKEGAEFLDKILPDWYNKINTSYLDMEEFEDSILGQLSSALDKAGIIDEDAGEHPFESLFPRQSFSKENAFGANTTDASWIVQIQLRREKEKSMAGSPSNKKSKAPKSKELPKASWINIEVNPSESMRKEAEKMFELTPTQKLGYKNPTLYLTGSRFLGIHSESSNWDFMVSSEELNLQEILDLGFADVGSYGQSECVARWEGDEDPAKCVDVQIVDPKMLKFKLEVQEEIKELLAKGFSYPTNKVLGRTIWTNMIQDKMNKFAGV